jgi:hydroxyethylthiazole kinase
VPRGARITLAASRLDLAREAGEVYYDGGRHMMIDAAAVGRCLAAIRRRRPLVHNITNLVVTNTTANALLALGASPAMVEGTDEVAEFVVKSDALVVNLGTMSADRAAAIRLAVAAARQSGKPWVLDPVAVGVLRYRSWLARDLLPEAPTAIRGNASEIISLEGRADGMAHGVDSSAASEAALAAAQRLARATGAAVAVTGAVDHVTDGTRLISIHNGDPLMARVTGMGCTATAIIGACLAVEPDRLAATVYGLAIIAVAGELAAARARGPGSLQLELLDALYQLDATALAARVRLGA